MCTHDYERYIESRGGGTYLQLGGQDNITRCRRQCIEARSADQSVRSAEKNFRLHFSAIRMGSRGTFVLFALQVQMYEDCRSRGRDMCFLAQISLTNVIRTYTGTGILDCGLVPKPFGFS